MWTAVCDPLSEVLMIIFGEVAVGRAAAGLLAVMGKHPKVRIPSLSAKV